MTTMRNTRVTSRAIGVLLPAAAALALSSCQYADDGARLLKGAFTESAPIVRSLPPGADDAALARSAVLYLDDVDQAVLSRARALAQDEDVQTAVFYACNLSGVAQADPADVVAALDSAADAASGQDGLELVVNDATTTAANVTSATEQTGVMTNAAAVSVVVFQQVYC